MSPVPFVETLARNGLPWLRRASLTTLQVNIGRRCDLACHHCHVEAGPQRPERLAAKTADRILELSHTGWPARRKPRNTSRSSSTISIPARFPT